MEMFKIEWKGLPAFLLACYNDSGIKLGEFHYVLEK